MIWCLIETNRQMNVFFSTAQQAKQMKLTMPNDEEIKSCINYLSLLPWLWKVQNIGYAVTVFITLIDKVRAHNDELPCGRTV